MRAREVSDTAEDLASLLNALASGPRLEALKVSFSGEGSRTPSDECRGLLPAFAKLVGLVKLELLLFSASPPEVLGDVVGALAPLSGLTDLSLHVWCYDPVVPASLAALKQLRKLDVSTFLGLVLEPGCLDLLVLESLAFFDCTFADSPVQLPGLGDLSSLTSLAIEYCGLLSLANCGLERLPSLQHLNCNDLNGTLGRASTGRVWPADMGTLKSMLLSLDIGGMALACFPFFFTQLTALHCLKASWNDIPVVPAGVTALRGLGMLELGRKRRRDLSGGVPPVNLECLDASALGDLSSFAHLRMLSFECCEVKLSCAFSDAAGHGALVKLVFNEACPAPECMVAMLQYRQELQRRGRGGVLHFEREPDYDEWEIDRAYRLRLQSESDRTWQALTPAQKFRAALDACGF